MRSFSRTTQFKKDVKRPEKRGKNLAKLGADIDGERTPLACGFRRLAENFFLPSISPGNGIKVSITKAGAGRPHGINADLSPVGDFLIRVALGNRSRKSRSPSFMAC